MIEYQKNSNAINDKNRDKHDCVKGAAGLLENPSGGINAEIMQAKHRFCLLTNYLIKRNAKGTRKGLPLVAAITPRMENTKWQIPTAAITRAPIKIMVRIKPAT